MSVFCQKCKKEFDPEEDGSAEIKGLMEDGQQVGPSVHYCLDCYFGNKADSEEDAAS